MIKSNVDPDGAPRSGRTRILVVDDEDSLREGLAKALRNAPERYEVETAGDGVEAGMRVARFGPDVVILDLLMPAMGGLETCRRLRALADVRPMSIIVLTGYPGGGNAESAFVHGADVCLTKPQSIESIREHINDLVDAR